MSIIKKLFSKKEDLINESDLDEIYLLINPVFDNALGINYINFNNLKLYFKPNGECWGVLNDLSYFMAII